MRFLAGIALVLLYQTNNPNIVKINNAEIVDLINSIVVDNRYETKDFSAAVFKKENKPGSAGILGGHEINHSFYIAISEFDEYPVQSLFLIGGFYNPDFEIESLVEELILKVEYGGYKNRLTKKYKIALHSVTEMAK